MQGEDALQMSARAVLARTESILKSLPAVVQANGIDALLIDTVQFYAELGAMQLGMPYIHVSAALHFDYSGQTPLCLYGWPHQTTPAALARNREGLAKFVKLLDGNNAGVKAHAKAVGLNIDWGDPGSTLSPFASITQIPRAFDFESSRWHSQVPPHRSVPRWQRPGEGGFPLGANNRRPAHLRFNGDDIEWPGRCLSDHCSCPGKA